MLDPNPVDLVRHADRDLLPAGQDVELGQEEIGDAVVGDRLLDDQGVEPAAAAGASGRGAELATRGPQTLAVGVQQLGRERTLADARRVGLGDAHDAIDAGRSDARAGAGPAGRRVRRGDVRVGAVVDVEVVSLGALKQHDLALVQGVVQLAGRVADHRPDALGEAEQVVGDLGGIDRALVVELHQQLVLAQQRRLDLLAQQGLVEQVLHADAHAVDLVGVRGADAASGGADLLLAQEALGDPVNGAVIRRDDVGVGADDQAGKVDPARRQVVDLVEQHLEVDDDAVADHRDAGIQHAGRQQVHRELLAVDDDRVASVVAARVADGVVGAIAQLVGALALTLVAPLSSDDHDPRHVRLPRTKARRFPRPGSYCRILSAWSGDVAVNQVGRRPAAPRAPPPGRHLRGWPP